MSDICDQAKQYRNDVEMRALAHEASSEWHRKRGVQLGAAATLLSAVVGTSIFVTLTTQLNEGKLDLSRFGFGGGKSWVILSALGFILVLSPVLAGMQSFLKHPEQAATHKASYVAYCRLQQRIDLFLLRYPDDSSTNTERIRALEQLDAISRGIEKAATNSITLTKPAYDSAAKKRLKRKPNS